jgi:hypothetical protein
MGWTCSSDKLQVRIDFLRGDILEIDHLEDQMGGRKIKWILRKYSGRETEFYTSLARGL